MHEFAGWNASLISTLESISDDIVVLFLDDHFIQSVDHHAFVQAFQLMTLDSTIGLIKLQAGNAHSPELQFENRSYPFLIDRLGEYDREHHPFKRCNLVPTMFRRTFLLRLLRAVLANHCTSGDVGRTGALNFEVGATLETENATLYPERILGIRREPPDYPATKSIITCVANDGVREGVLQPHVILELKQMGIDAEA